ncbi:hypothetical protein Tco_1480229, partial [Tanacetum coccineum]
ARVESSGDEESLGEDASKQGRRITDIGKDEDITTVNDQIDADVKMFDVDTLTGDEVLAEQVIAAKDVNLSVDEVTLAQALIAWKSAKVQEKGDVIKEPSVPVSTVTASTKDTKFDEEVRLAREKAEKKQEANVVLTEEWDDIQAKIERKEESTLQQKSRREEEQTTNPSSINKNHVYLPKKYGRKEAQRLEEQIFLFYSEDLEQESTKKQKMEEDKDTAELKRLMEVIPDEEDVAIDVVPLATKPLTIVDWKIHKEVKKSYYLEDQYKLVKAKYGSTRPVEDLDLVLWSDLKTMFEPHVEDEIWKLQQ